MKENNDAVRECDNNIYNIHSRTTINSGFMKNKKTEQKYSPFKLVNIINWKLHVFCNTLLEGVE